MKNKQFKVAEDLLGMDPLPPGTKLDAGRKVVQKYLDTLLRGISELSDEEWDKLPETVQEWFNDAAQIVGIASDKGEVAIIPVPEKLEVPKKRGVQVVAKEEDETEIVKEKPKPEPKPKPKPKPKTTKSNAQVIRELICEDVSRNPADLANLLEDMGIESKESSIKNIWLNTTKAFEIAYAEGGAMKDGKDYLQAVSYEDEDETSVDEED